MKFIGLCPEEYVGIKAVFRNLQYLFRDIKDHEFEFVSLQEWAKDVACLDTDMLILGGWHPQYPLVINQHCFTMISLLNCSSYGQMDLSRELQIFQEQMNLLLKRKIHFLLFGDKNVAIVEKIRFKESAVKDCILYFPYSFAIEKYPFTNPTMKLNYLTLLLPTHPRKNIFNQLSAFRHFLATGKSYRLYTNINLVDESLARFTGWLSEKQYIETISKAKLGLHVTFTESLGYGALEHLACGTPTLISSPIAMNFNNFTNDSKIQQTLKELTIFNYDNPLEISNTISHILNLDEDTYKNLCEKCREFSLKISNQMNLICSQFFVEWCEKCLKHYKQI